MHVMSREVAANPIALLNCHAVRVRTVIGCGARSRITFICAPLSSMFTCPSRSPAHSQIAAHRSLALKFPEDPERNMFFWCVLTHCCVHLLPPIFLSPPLPSAPHPPHSRCRLQEPTSAEDASITETFNNMLNDPPGKYRYGRVVNCL